MEELLQRMEYIEDVRQDLSQKAVAEKSNEITAIPELLEKLQIKGRSLR